MARLVDEHGRPLQLGEKVGEGGEGAVYKATGRGGLAVKVYSAALTAEKAQKIKILAQWDRRQVSSYTAWPVGLVLDERGQPRGVLLPFVSGGKDVHNLYTPSSRRQHFPKAGFRFLCHVSTNIARAFASVHANGLVIGDVNPGSILVLPDGTVRLIDIDSFQVPVAGGSPLLCTVGVPLFLAPELHGAKLSSVVRTPDHDNFGLGITVFQLLMLGRHPYAGRYLGSGDMPIERAIVEHRFVFGQQATARHMQRPPHTVGLEILSPSVATLFESAFEAPSVHRPRPTAKAWVDALEQMAAGLVTCGYNSTHQYAKEAVHCPWCAFEQHSGVFIFGIAAVASPDAFEAEYQGLVRLVAAVPRPTPQAATAPTGAVVVNPAAQNVARKPRRAWFTFAVGVLLAVAGVPLLPVGLLLWVLGVGCFVLGAAILHGPRRPWIQAYRAARAQHVAAMAALEHANRFPLSDAARAAAAKAQSAWQDVPRQKEEKYRELHRTKRQMQLQQHLQRRLIRSANIKGIGLGRVTALSAYGITTAWDVSPLVGNIPQFGPVLTERLMTWRQSLERSFVYDSSSPLPKEAVARVEAQLHDARRRALSALRSSLQSLQAAAATEAAGATAAARGATATASALRQAEADVTAAMGRVPI